MSLSKWFQQAKEAGQSAFSKTTEVIGSGVGFVTETIGNTKIFGSTESSDSYDSEKTDEKHYFLIPDRLSEFGYSLYTMRCLPDGVPPINDLPKARFFHLPNDHALPTVEKILLTEAESDAEAEESSPTSIGNRLHELADQVDRLDSKVFNGVLIIGGLVALINPIAGAAVAMKALLPSAGLILSKYGLKYAGETATNMEAQSRIKAAQKDVLQQFKESNTHSLANPILGQLDKALETEEEEYDPILDFDLESLDFGTQGKQRLLKLTCQAILNVYSETLKNKKTWKEASLGPEDIRFLELLKGIAEDKPVS